MFDDIGGPKTQLSDGPPAAVDRHCSSHSTFEYRTDDLDQTLQQPVPRPVFSLFVPSLMLSFWFYQQTEFMFVVVEKQSDVCCTNDDMSVRRGTS